GDGARIYFGGKTEGIPVMKVDKVVDTTGAGDAFWGGFLSNLLSQGVKETKDLTMEKLVRAAKYGAVSGGLCVQKPGGIPALPTKEEIEGCL
ncbi:MAG: carbohydrate kinase, partial [Lachnospiraceae bacterium]|nr:carbohydrate kinase [Lachnospiraceae bacterium]